MINESSRISLKYFIKNIPTTPSVADEVSLANKGGGFEVFGSELIQSNGLGRTQGWNYYISKNLLENGMELHPLPCLKVNLASDLVYPSLG